MPEVVIVRKRDAKTDPPTDSNARMTDIGVAYYVRDHRGEAWFYIEDDHATMPCDPQPRVWFDFPRDTERETLTTDDIAWVLHEADQDLVGDSEEAARLRAALDALGGHHEQRTT